MNENYAALAEKLLLELCVIPAPSGYEEKRAEHILKTLTEWGISAYIDELKNVICVYEGESADEITVFCAHTDIVFPDMEPLTMTMEGSKLMCPGCGDDTAPVAILMSVLKKLHSEKASAKNTILFVFNSCEEGLGNLRGTRAIMDKYGQKIRRFVTFDDNIDAMVNKSVGSHRYQVTVKTKGGHSFTNFGNTNSAAVLSEIITEIYTIKVPEKGNHTTYNVGLISGGTSVNTIVQEAYMLCEYRSDDYQDLKYMEEEFKKVFHKIQIKYSSDNEAVKAEIIVDLVGDRPCMHEVDQLEMDKLTEIVTSIQKKYGRCEVSVNSGSTDCNIPHSMGIPAVCAGCYIGGGAHTREEWVDLSSIPTGVEIVEDIVRTLCF